MAEGFSYLSEVLNPKKELSINTSTTSTNNKPKNSSQVIKDFEKIKNVKDTNNIAKIVKEIYEDFYERKLFQQLEQLKNKLSADQYKTYINSLYRETKEQQQQCNKALEKIGLSKNPVGREYQLNRTKGPIGYRIVRCYKVDNMGRVEKMLHNILDSRRAEGEWFTDDGDTLTGEFIGFMDAHGAEVTTMEELKPVERPSETDTRLIDTANRLGGDTMLIRTYKGVDYDVLLDSKGILHFKGETFNTPNKFYNGGLLKFVTGKRGNSGTNQLSQFRVKETGERLTEPVLSE